MAYEYHIVLPQKPVGCLQFRVEFWAPGKGWVLHSLHSEFGDAMTEYNNYKRYTIEVELRIVAQLVIMDEVLY